MNVSIEIKKPLLKSYLKHIFRSDPKGNLIATKTHDFGQLLCSLVRYSNTRLEQLPTENSEAIVTFRLPKVRSLASAESYHLYYTKEDALKLNDYLQTLFNIEFDRYYLAGRKKQYQQKEIISTFVTTRNLTGLSDVAGSLKKRNYRREADLLEERTQELLHKAYNRNDRILFDESLVVKTEHLNY